MKPFFSWKNDCRLYPGEQDDKHERFKNICLVLFSIKYLAFKYSLGITYLELTLTTSVYVDSVWLEATFSFVCSLLS